MVPPLFHVNVHLGIWDIDSLAVKSQLDRLVKFDHAGADEFLKVFETAVADAVLAGELSARSR